MSHGGALSRQESLYYAVPMINFPIFAEQEYNANLAHLKKFAISLDINSFTADDLKTAILELLTNPV